MIEVIYEKEQEQEESMKTGWIPKNIRQIGNPEGERKIYIEDYVVSYINKLARPEHIYSRGAILVGESKNTKNGSAIFISGAIEAPNLELDMDETVFNNEIWTQIYDTIKTYFPNLEVVGWFLSRLGFSAQINEKIQKTHLENFPGKDKVLYVVDSLEKEDAFYLYEQGRLKKQEGYYIYYDRNENMQNYIQSKSEKEERILNPIEKKDREVVAKVRTQVGTLGKKKKKNLLTQFAGFIFATGILATGVTVMNNYDKMRILENKLEQLNLSMNQKQEDKTVILNEEGQEDYVESVNMDNESISSLTGETKKENAGMNETKKENVGMNETKEENAGMNETKGENAGIEATKEEKEKTEGTKEGYEKTEKRKEGNDKNEGIASLEEGSSLAVLEGTGQEPGREETVEAMAQNYYYVEEGDTLLSISLKMYQSGKYIQAIKEANQLEDENYIKVGQKLILPPVEQ